MMSEMMNTEHLLLDAVNILLETINEQPIEDEADFDVIIEARTARSKLYEVKRAVLSEEWDFNRDTNYVFPTDNEGMIAVPSNVLDISGNNGDVIMRNWRLYSKSRQSHIFDEAVTCDVVWDMPFNSLSHPIRHYITIRAARIFSARLIGDSAAIQFNEIDEEDARLACRRSESRTGKYNMLTSGSYGVNNKISRG
jgi:hypothetical protein